MSKLKSHPIDPSFFDARDRTLFTWLGGAGILINSRGTIALIDPLISLIQHDDEPLAETGHRLLIDLPILAEQVPRLDAVLYTHADNDHFAEPTARTLNDRLRPVFVAPPPVLKPLEQISVEQRRTRLAAENARWMIGSLSITVTPAMHDWQPTDPWKRADCCGFLVTTPDGVIWHPGDTRLIDELRKVTGVDVLFFDVARVKTHLGPTGSAQLARTCGATDLVAYHYGTYDVPPGGPFGCDPDDCLSYLEGVDARFHRPDPGRVFHLPVGPQQENGPGKR
ncbi:MAG TPA: MBL fold metallo-hydrolase [Phycisphaerae bacterium]|nr:MBL fold metallo-hydrolase [Phycisphaerae bacterium]